MLKTAAISLLATALSFLDTLLAETPPISDEAADMIEAKFFITLAISTLRRDPNIKEQIAHVFERALSRRQA
jgi:hypothetical protein